MLSLLFLGFIIGMRHALDADHLVAVAAISSQQPTMQNTIRHGLVWGVGHTTTLFLFGSIVLWMDTIVPEQLAHYLEVAVGFMLVALGTDVVRRVIRDKIHYHRHQHNLSTEHFHAHSHAGDIAHTQSSHSHEHGAFPIRTLFIGFMHGMAGSAALVLLTLESIHSVAWGMVYMLIFGVGSLVGMAVISTIIAVSLSSSAKKLTWMHNGLQFGIGALSIGLGVSIIYV